MEDGPDEVIYRCDQVEFPLNGMTEAVQIYPVVVSIITSLCLYKNKKVGPYQDHSNRS